MSTLYEQLHNSATHAKGLDRNCPVCKPIIKRQALEARVMRSAIAELLAAGFTLSVHDGEEMTVKQSTDARAVFAALRTTDDDRMITYRADGSRVGSIWFVYGNDGWDVISDYHISLEPYLTKTNALVDKLSS